MRKDSINDVLDKPEKCLTCNHAIVLLENEHKGWCKFELESVVRCDRSGYKVGCVCAEIYCDKKKKSEDRMSKETTCENCINANECLMYDPTMRRCPLYKARRIGNDQKQAQAILSNEKTT